MGLAGFNRARLRAQEGEQSPSLSTKPTGILHIIKCFDKECPICDQKFPSGRAVSSHIRMKHPHEQYKYDATAQ